MLLKMFLKISKFGFLKNNHNPELKFRLKCSAQEKIDTCMSYTPILIAFVEVLDSQKSMECTSTQAEESREI